MSFLLDALRKSEDQKRRGAVPSIHGGPEGPSRRGLPRMLTYALLLVVPLLLVLTWALLRDGDQRAQQTQFPQATARARQAPELTKPAKETTPAESGSGRVIPVPAPNANRTPVENYRSPAQADSNDRGSASNAVSAARRSGDVSGVDANRAGTPESTPPGGTAQAQQKPGSSQQSAGSETPLPGLIMYWELPASVRDQINELHISVMVFAERPEDRFLLMNGARYIEGDEPQAGLQIEEITREGVIFTFRRYRFLLSQ